MKRKTRGSVPASHPPPTAEQSDGPERLARMPDDQFGRDDIPKPAGKGLAGKQRRGFCRPVKQEIAARLDEALPAWLKSAGRGYQTRMNAFPREAMLIARWSGAVRMQPGWSTPSGSVLREGKVTGPVPRRCYPPVAFSPSTSVMSYSPNGLPWPQMAPFTAPLA